MRRTVSSVHDIFLRPLQGNPENFCLKNPESWVLESAIQLKESGIPLTIGIQNPTGKHWNRVPGIWNTAQGIRNPTKDWNPESY